MRADYPVVLDACVIANYGVFDLYLRLSEDPRLLLPRWSKDILSEARSTYIGKLSKPWPADRTDRMLQAAQNAFPEAMVEGYEPLIGSCTNDPKDRHVLAAAIKDRCQTIVTFNLRDFRREDLEPWDVIAAHPGEYLITLYSHSAGILVDRLNDIANVRNMQVEEVLSRLRRTIPTFVDHVSSDLGWKLP